MNQSQAGAIPVRHPDVLVAERNGTGLLSRHDAGSIPAGDTNEEHSWPMMRLVSQRRCLRRETDSISVWVAATAMGRRVMATYEPPKLEERVRFLRGLPRGERETTMTCTFCAGPAHPATGCVYGPRTIACRACTEQFWRWLRAHTNKMPRRRADRPGPTISFYEAAAKFRDTTGR